MDVRAMKAIEERIRKKEMVVKRKAIKIILIVIAVIVYFNIGYLVAYSTLSTTSGTPTTQMILKILDFYNVIGKNEQAVNILFFVFTIAIWPLVVIAVWGVNLAVMFFDAIILIFLNILDAIKWIFTGGFWKLVGFIK